MITQRRANIVGLGLIGGSIGLALRERGWHVTGDDHDQTRVDRALTIGVLDEQGLAEIVDITFVATPVLTVADHEGRQIVNYRFGPIILHTNGGASYGMGPDGKAPFELGGTFAVAGKPFAFSSANVP